MPAPVNLKSLLFGAFYNHVRVHQLSALSDRNELQSLRKVLDNIVALDESFAPDKNRYLDESFALDNVVALDERFALDNIVALVEVVPVASWLSLRTE